MKYFNERMQELVETSLLPLFAEIGKIDLSMEDIATPLFEDGECEIIAWKLKSNEDILKIVNQVKE